MIINDPNLTTSTVTKQGINRITIDPERSQSPTIWGDSFVSVGKYENLCGTAYVEIDPVDPRNSVITDLENAPVNCRVMVEYSTDIFILKAVDLS